MAQEKKYYTPEITEFNGWFKYEQLVDLGDNLGENWIQKTYGVADVFMGLTGIWNENNIELNENILKGKIRVKYLDKEDVESFGFRFNVKLGFYEITIQRNQNVPAVDYWLELINFKDNIGWDLTITGRDNDCFFAGIV